MKIVPKKSGDVTLPTWTVAVLQQDLPLVKLLAASQPVLFPKLHLLDSNFIR